MNLCVSRGKGKKNLAFLLAFYVLAVSFAVFCSFWRNSPQKPIAVAVLFLLASVSADFLYIQKELKSSKDGMGLFVAILCNAIAAILASIALVYLYQSVILKRDAIYGILSADNLVRIYLVFLVVNLFNACVIFELLDVLEFVFKHRWSIAMLLVGLLVLAKINFSNVCCFTDTIQPESTTEFTMPLFGFPRAIRSDEWLVTTPRKISAEYSNYREFNYIARATKNYNIGCADLYFSYSALSNVLNLGYYLFGSEYGASFYWCSFFVFSFMIAYEFSYIISKKDRLVALLGASMIGLSQFTLWWSLEIHIPALQAIIVCAVYFFETKSIPKKAFLALGVALAGNTFICTIYPAWQVPMAYVLLALIAWVVIDHIDEIKALKALEWLIIVIAFLFMCSVVIAYLYNSREYNMELMSTLYPGARFDVGGGSLDWAMTYIASLLFPLKSTWNNSEAGSFFNLFPLPMMFALWIVLKKTCCSIKTKKYRADNFYALLLVPVVIILIYCTLGFPALLAKISLMSYSTAKRALDVLGLANAYLLIRIIGDNDKNNKLPTWLVVAMVSIVLFFVVKTTSVMFPNYMPLEYLVVASILVVAFALVSFSYVSKRKRTIVIGIITLTLSISGILVLPISRGLDSLLRKPASYAVHELVSQDPDGKWIACGGTVPPQFLIANGAPTINSTNYVPNMELWGKLDPDGVYASVYNRYCHVDCKFTNQETSFELLYPDSIRLYLSYSDFLAADISYVYSSEPINEPSEQIDFELVYSEGNAYIYRVVYL